VCPASNESSRPVDDDIKELPLHVSQSTPVSVMHKIVVSVTSVCMYNVNKRSNMSSNAEYLNKSISAGEMMKYSFETK